MNRSLLFLLLEIIFYILLLGCGKGKSDYDATGTFEVTEIVVSSEAQGKILSLDIKEGDSVASSQPVGLIDSLQLSFEKQQLIANHKAVDFRSVDIAKQIGALEEQIIKQQREKARFQKLFERKAATQKQVDDISAQLIVLEKELKAQRSTFNRNNEGVRNESRALAIQINRLEDLIMRCRIEAPVSGIVLVKYAEAGEYAIPGTPLFKIGDLHQPFLRVYVTSEQLADLKLNQEIEVIADFGKDHLRHYKGKITWIGDKSEFTPKGIQTKNERANLVYPVKIQLRNDGFIKIGMYGGVRFKASEK